MTKEYAKAAVQTLRAAGWDVRTEPSRTHGSWYLVGKAVDGGPDVFGLSHNDMKVLIVGGQVKRI